MNIDKELSEFKESFGKSGILTKVFLIIGFFISVSSITSLSSMVVEWKGFILEGIMFYQQYFVAPISSAALYVGLQYSVIEIHVATITSIYLSVGLRLIIIGQNVAFREINAKYNSEVTPKNSMYWFLVFAAPIGIWLWYGVSNPDIQPWYVIFVSVFFPAFIVVPKLFMSKFGWVYYEKNHFSYIKSYYGYMAVIFIVIGAMAAINSGLVTK